MTSFDSQNSEQNPAPHAVPNDSRINSQNQDNDAQPNIERIKIIIADDQRFVRETLKRNLSLQIDFDIVGLASNGAETLHLVQRHHPHIALIDYEMPDMSGLEVAQALSQQAPNTKVLIISIHNQANYIRTALAQGARGYLLKDTPSEELAHAIRFVNRGYLQLSPGLFEKLETSSTAGEHELAIPGTQSGATAIAQGQVNSLTSPSQASRIISPVLSGSTPYLRKGKTLLSASILLAILPIGGWWIHNLTQGNQPRPARTFTVEIGTIEDVINESGIVELGAQQTLKSPVDGGVVEQVLIRDGLNVKANQILIVLKDPDRQTALPQHQLEIQKQALKVERAQQKILEAQEKLANARNQASSLNIDQSLIAQTRLKFSQKQEQVANVQARLQNQKRELANMMNLRQKGIISERDFNLKSDQVLQLESELLETNFALRESELELNRLKIQQSNNRSDLQSQIVNANLQLEDAKLEVNQEKRELARLRLEEVKIYEQNLKTSVQSPLTGKALSVLVKPGDVVKLGQPMLTLGQAQVELVKVELHPLDAKRTKIGQVVRVRAIGPNSQDFDGNIISIDEFATTDVGQDEQGKKQAQQAQATITLSIRLDQPSQSLIPGSKVDVEILAQQQQDVVVLPREMVQSSKQGQFVWIRDQLDHAQAHPVKLGLEGLTSVEITAGLQPGDEIIAPLPGHSLEKNKPITLVD